ncbi:hypothetical protein PoB_001503200 [Plakobranchus ocellatus]|uniref:Uncharacterized protein n=1 Tax=Plakobranchus ocellatus TaxID=259542 RepID=A0AAV3Z1X5_9GAST|nr:hypothetical protein PoB_001503200 [Plakobranchus ocellatus]
MAESFENLLRTKQPSTLSELYATHNKSPKANFTMELEMEEQRKRHANKYAARNTLESVWRELRPRQSYSSQSGGRQTDSKADSAAARRLQSAFGGRYRDSRVFLAAAMLTLESFWCRVVLACYTGPHLGQDSQMPPCYQLFFPPGLLARFKSAYIILNCA